MPLLRNTLIFFLSLSAVLLTQHLTLPAQAEESASPRTYDERLSVGDLTEQYHEAINDLFNDKIRELVALGTTGRAEDLESLLTRIEPPALRMENGLPTKRAPCDSGNLSTYCLPLDGTNEFFIFREALIRVQERLQTQARTQVQSLEEAQQAQNAEAGNSTNNAFSTDVQQQQRAVIGVGAELNKIQEELSIARTALDQGLAAYNELQLALPMHMKYKQIIGTLEEYRGKLSSIRRQVEWYPATFIDVTTSKCT